jgi:[acyl-carrier-protein] S-malonyltransferase
VAPYPQVGTEACEIDSTGTDAAGGLSRCPKTNDVKTVTSATSRPCHTRVVSEHRTPAPGSLVLAFPGQGSLREGAGLPWQGTEAFAVVHTIGEIAGVDVARLLTVAPEDELVATQSAQLATFALSLCVLEATGLAKRASYAVGHSLGEYTALVAAGLLDLADGTRLVGVRGAAMRAAADASPGGLVAVIGGDLDAAERACAAVDGLSIANVNGPGQIVLGGGDRALAELEANVRDYGFRRAIRLKVDGAFHTSLMAPAIGELATALASVRFVPGHARVVANVDGAVHDDPADWTDLLLRQLVEPVRFDACVGALPSGAVVVECGAGSVLKGLISRIRDDVEVTSVTTPEDLASLDERP